MEEVQGRWYLVVHTNLYVKKSIFLAFEGLFEAIKPSRCALLQQISCYRIKSVKNSHISDGGSHSCGQSAILLPSADDSQTETFPLHLQLQILKQFSPAQVPVVS